MKNDQLITKILNRITYKDTQLIDSLFMYDGEKIREYTEIIKDKGQWVIGSIDWLIPLVELKNRELIKLYQSL
jgi:hypothetical protein